MRWLVTQHLSLLYSIPSCPYIPSHPACCWLVLIFWGLVPPRRTSRIYTTGSERDQSRHEALQDADEQWEGGRNKKEESHTPGLSMKFKKRPMFKNKTSNGSRRRRCVLHILSILLTLFFLGDSIEYPADGEWQLPPYATAFCYFLDIFRWQRCSISDVSHENGPARVFITPFCI